jgi:flagellar L-ring protein precursor FlgH
MTLGYWKQFASLMAIASALCACSAVDRLENVGGSPPAMTPIANPLVQAGDQGAPLPGDPQRAASLWQTGAHSFFHDPRASRVGDVITVDVTIADSGQITNSTTTNRTNAETANLTNFFGLETSLPSILPGANPAALVNMGSNGANTGVGAVNRAETINLTLAALVNQVLPNGNLVIGGRQQVLVNNEMRELQISGIVRTEDITSDNTVNLAQIAEARIAYGGHGQITNMQEPRYGEQLFDILMPF